MPDETRAGVILLAAVLCTPWLAGLLVGYRFTRRVDRLGWPWALFPGFFKTVYHKVKERLHE